MAQAKIEKYLYLDLEKFHRVIGYYEGQKLKPLEVHEKHIAGNIEKNFRAPDQYIRRIQFDLLMKQVLSEQNVIFETDKPEATLLYLLFSEGIKSLVLLRDLTATEIKQWCVLVRETLVALDSGSSKDLASVLWKTPFRNLRARIYNTLMDLADSRRAAEEKKQPTPAEAPVVKTEVKSNWHDRDSEWDLPSADNIVRDLESYRSIDEGEMLRLKTQLQVTAVDANSKSVLESLQLSNHEVDLLSNEMSSYDQSQVEFNLLGWNTSVLDGSFGCDPKAEKFIEESVTALARSFVTRFHPGLILHLMDQIERFQGTRFGSLCTLVKSTISKTLTTPENNRRLLESLADPNRAPLTKRLLPNLDREQLPQVIDFYLEAKDQTGLVSFLEILFQRELPLEEILMSWGEARLSAVLPLFKELSWKEKSAFLQKALRSKYREVVKQASYYILKLQIRSDHAFDIYRKLPAEIQEIWMKELKDHAPVTDWKGFVELVCRSQLWHESERPHQINWLHIFFKYLKENTLLNLERLVSGRKFFFWPKFPALRETILTVGLDMTVEPTKTRFNEWVKREVRLRFQDPDLKNRLERRMKQIS